MGVHKCLICFEQVDNPPLKNSKTSSTKGKSCLLTKQLSVLYLVNKLLQVPLDECQKYLQNYGNPGEWIILCTRCTSVVQEAEEIREKIIRLQAQLNNIQIKLKCQMRVKVESECFDGAYDNEVEAESTGGAAYQIRLYVSSSDESFMGGEICPETENDLSAPDFDMSIKYEDTVTILGLNSSIVNSSSVSPPTDDPDWHCDLNDNNSSNHEDNEDSEPEWTPPVTKKTRRKKKSLYSSSRSKRLKRLAVKTEPKPINPQKRKGPRKSKKQEPGRRNGKSLVESKAESSPKIKKNETAVFPCADCSEIFTSFSLMRRHINSTHKIGLKCEFCGKIIATPQSLENHLRCLHTPHSVLECSGCKLVIKPINAFIQHLSTTSNPLCQNNALKCNKCRIYHAATQEAMDLHTKITHMNILDTPFKCDICQKSFLERRTLVIHETLKHGNEEEPPKNFVCERCGAAFTLLDYLKRHIQYVHLNREPGGKKYPCGTCGKIFRSAGKQRRHEVIHKDVFPFLCSLCGKAFKLRNSLNIHMWSHDPDRKKKYSPYMPRKSKVKSKPLNEEAQEEHMTSEISSST